MIDINTPMAEFKEGDDVEVMLMVSSCGNPDLYFWLRQKIVSYEGRNKYIVAYDGTGAFPRTVNAKDIRPVQP